MWQKSNHLPYKTRLLTRTDIWSRLGRCFSTKFMLGTLARLGHQHSRALAQPERRQSPGNITSYRKALFISPSVLCRGLTRQAQLAQLTSTISPCVSGKTGLVPLSAGRLASGLESRCLEATAFTPRHGRRSRSPSRSSGLWRQHDACV